MNNFSHAVKKKISRGNSKEKGRCDYVIVLRTVLGIFLDKKHQLYGILYSRPSYFIPFGDILIRQYIRVG